MPNRRCQAPAVPQGNLTPRQDDPLLHEGNLRYPFLKVRLGYFPGKQALEDKNFEKDCGKRFKAARSLSMGVARGSDAESFQNRNLPLSRAYQLFFG